MLGSVLFMASALASYVLPSSGDVLDARIAVAGTLFGAVCFFVGAALMLPGLASFASNAVRRPAIRPDPTPDPDHHLFLQGDQMTATSRPTIDAAAVRQPVRHPGGAEP